jgi:hypothetical protein
MSHEIARRDKAEASGRRQRHIPRLESAHEHTIQAREPKDRARHRLRLGGSIGADTARPGDTEIEGRDRHDGAPASNYKERSRVSTGEP